MQVNKFEAENPFVNLVSHAVLFVFFYPKSTYVNRSPLNSGQMLM